MRFKEQQYRGVLVIHPVFFAFIAENGGRGERQ